MRLIFRPFTIAVVLLIAFVAVLIGAWASLEAPYASKAYPGVRVMGSDVGGMSAVEIYRTVSRAAQSPYNDPLITLRVNDRKETLRPIDLGANVDVAATTDKALRTGRESNPIAWLSSRVNLWRNGVDVAPVVFTDEESVSRVVNRWASEIDRPAREANVKVDSGHAQEVTAQNGITLDKQAAKERIRAALTTNKAIELTLPTSIIEPKITSASEAASDASKLLAGDVTILVPRWDRDDNPLTPIEGLKLRNYDLATYLMIEPVNGADGKTKLAANIKPDRLRTLLEPLAPAVKREPQDARFTFDDKSGALQLVEKDHPGQALDVDGTINSIIANLRANKRDVTLQTKAIDAKIKANTTAQQLGITKLVAQATTNFAGSTAARVKNVQVAASRFHGILVPPDAEFSFNQFLGDVSKEDGFEEGLIIVGDRTIKGVGGGVCQVSTTVFQTALRAGLPVLERTQHAYRVGYYERGMGPGFDATVFSPYVDLKFKNDTAGYLLIENYFNAAGTLTFKFYGTPDSREVNIGKSTITKVVTHGPDIYEPDPEKKMAEKTVKQIDYAVDGATIVFDRVVKKDGKVTINEKFTSNYVPWQSVFRFGPGFTPPSGAIVREAKP